MPAAALDVLIFGGGASGLWVLDELRRAGYRVLLLEAHDLGSGQTVVSQGIIHGGLKYTLGGLLTPSARAIRDMPLVWRRCLAGEREPNLAAARRRAEYCHLWQTRAMTSRAAMFGARAGLRTAPVKLEAAARPTVLLACPGVVARVDEQIVAPDSLVEALADRNAAHILKIDLESGLEIVTSGPGRVDLVRLINPATGDPLDLAPRSVVLTAGQGNGDLRRRVGLDPSVAQLRPLHMVVGRGDLPVLNGHCVDRMHTRATITTSRDYAGRPVWQVGGQIAERGVDRDPRDQIAAALGELRGVLPRLDLSGVEWLTYRATRAEGSTAGGRRPADAVVRVEGTTITGWPTKLALVPRLAERIGRRLPAPDDEGRDAPGPAGRAALAVLERWPRPDVAALPWEESASWINDL